MVTVYIKDKESIDDAIRRFNKIIEKEGITATLKEKMYYTKPSKAKRERMNKIKRKIEKKKRKEQSRKAY